MIKKMVIYRFWLLVCLLRSINVIDVMILKKKKKNVMIIKIK